jgi:hypothetical protein
MNATYLFEKPLRFFHNSETYWSSLFASQVLQASRSGVTLSIPTYTYNEIGANWQFSPSDSLVIPQGLDFTQVVVEGKIRTGFVSSIAAPLPVQFNGLRPDLTMLWNKKVYFAETKTIGAKLEDKDMLYLALANWLVTHGCQSEALLLISAGHENAREVRQLASSTWHGPKRIILWEKFFEAVVQQVDHSLIRTLIPDIEQYYTPENRFMSGSLT